MHAPAWPWLERAHAGEFEFVVAAHTLAELYAGLSGIPFARRFSPTSAWQVIQDAVISHAKLAALTELEHVAVIEQASQMGLAGGSVYDALIARAAQKAKVDKLLTFNIDRFLRVWPEGKRIIRRP